MDYETIGTEPIRSERTSKLCADFKNGYAVNFAFPVSEAFKTALDIQFTEYNVYVFGKDGKHIFEESIEKKGKRTKRKKQKKVAGWTQGLEFNFKAGDIIYSSTTAYTDWANYIQDPKEITLKVIHGVKANGDNDGLVMFNLTKYNASNILTITMSQIDFVRYLQSQIIVNSANQINNAI
ncbi:MAG: hypothetical protein HQM01_07160 [Magnetococcales bacterium]|nr:hypothetical protein [Magnetococcales bacterium]